MLKARRAFSPIHLLQSEQLCTLDVVKYRYEIAMIITEIEGRNQKSHVSVE